MAKSISELTKELKEKKNKRYQTLGKKTLQYLKLKERKEIDVDDAIKSMNQNIEKVKEIQEKNKQKIEKQDSSEVHEEWEEEIVVNEEDCY